MRCHGVKRCQRRRDEPILQVHDELIFEVAAGEEEILTQVVREAMGSAAKLSVPLDVNIGVGKSWAEAAH